MAKQQGFSLGATPKPSTTKKDSMPTKQKMELKPTPKPVQKSGYSLGKTPK